MISRVGSSLVEDADLYFFGVDRFLRGVFGVLGVSPNNYAKETKRY